MMTQAVQMSLFQGVSDMTQKKEMDFFGICNTRLSQRKFQEYIKQVYVCDVFCGDGQNVVNGEILAGSPLKMADALIASGITETKDVFLICSDIRRDAITKLHNHFSNFNYPFDYSITQNTADQQIKTIHQMALEDKDAHFIVVVDPNGPKTLPFFEIEAMAHDPRITSRVDIVVNVSATSVKRMVQHRLSAGAKYNWWINMVNCLGNDFILRLAKYYKAAWIRKPMGDRQQWVILAFFNWSPPRSDWNKAGFINLNTAAGHEALLAYEGK